MATHRLQPVTEDEMYAIEFHDCELHEGETEGPEIEYRYPVWHATELQYSMHYRVSERRRALPLSPHLFRASCPIGPRRLCGRGLLFSEGTSFAAGQAGL